MRSIASIDLETDETANQRFVGAATIAAACIAHHLNETCSNGFELISYIRMSERLQSRFSESLFDCIAFQLFVICNC